MPVCFAVEAVNLCSPTQTGCTALPAQVLAPSATSNCAYLVMTADEYAAYSATQITSQADAELFVSLAAGVLVIAWIYRQLMRTVSNAADLSDEKH